MKKRKNQKNYKKVIVEEDYLKLETFEAFKQMLPKAEFVYARAQKFRIKKDEEE